MSTYDQTRTATKQTQSTYNAKPLPWWNKIPQTTMINTTHNTDTCFFKSTHK